MTEINIERKLVIGLITSTDFIKRLRKDIKVELIQSHTARMLVSWILEYFDKFHKAPFKSIEDIYFEKLKSTNIPKDVAEEIEEDILPDLSDEFIAEGVDVEYLETASIKYFSEQKLIQLKNILDSSINKGDLKEAENAILAHKTTTQKEDELILNDESVKEAVSKAFNNAYTPLIKFPGPLGEFWNHQLVRGGFIAFLSPEKRGKSITMLEIAMKAVQQDLKVAFFQAGDMTNDQQLMRIAIYLARKSNKEKYTGMLYIPEKDCIWNQLNKCDKEVRECDFGVFEEMGLDAKRLREEITHENILQAFKDEPTYKPCHNCTDYQTNAWGAVWIKEYFVKNELTEQEAIDKIYKFFVKNDRALRLSTHANGTLTVNKMRQILNSWEMRDGFIPDVIITDYADIMETETKIEFRHKQNQIWKELRGLNTETNTLLITATQSDADSYEKDILKLGNFSEDKRKYAHVTAFYGLNQDRTGREKKLGILRINELLLREDSYDSTKQVTILQALNIGRPFLTSYW